MSMYTHVECKVYENMLSTLGRMENCAGGKRCPIESQLMDKRSSQVCPEACGNAEWRRPIDFVASSNETVQGYRHCRRHYHRFDFILSPLDVSDESDKTMHAMDHIWKTDNNLQKSVPSRFVGPGNLIQIIDICCEMSFYQEEENFYQRDPALCPYTYRDMVKAETCTGSQKVFANFFALKKVSEPGFISHIKEQDQVKS
ncbi:hypothetical protein STEG23_022440, partial [Scotinomys teguina]